MKVFGLVSRLLNEYNTLVFMLSDADMSLIFTSSGDYVSLVFR